MAKSKGERARDVIKSISTFGKLAIFPEVARAMMLLQRQCEELYTSVRELQRDMRALHERLQTDIEDPDPLEEVEEVEEVEEEPPEPEEEPVDVAAIMEHVQPRAEPEDTHMTEDELRRELAAAIGGRDEQGE